jgi:hypothetical protein
VNFLDPLEEKIRDGLADLIEQVEHELRKLARERDRVENSIAELEAKRRAWAHALEATSGSIGSTPGSARDRLPTKRQAVLALLSEDTSKTWRLLEIRRELIRRGWMTETRRSQHALEVAVRAMEDRGELTRPTTGCYRISEPGTGQERLVA